MPLLRIEHVTTYRHAQACLGALQLVRLMPRREAGQEVQFFELEVSPEPSELDTRVDYFGNTCHHLAVRGAHTEFTMRAVSRVAREEPTLPLPGLAPPAAEIGRLTAHAVAGPLFTLEQYRHASPAVPLLPEARAIAKGIDVNLPVTEWIEELGERFGAQFAYDPTATTITSTVGDVLAGRRGVCQDFAHLWLACLRQLGFAASYVSGYLLTTPAPGQPRLRGSDAMHAWVSVWVPGTGWVDYDPTNRCFAGSHHVVVARGRDYTDVTPTRGVFRGGAGHMLSLGVTVEALDN